MSDATPTLAPVESRAVAISSDLGPHGLVRIRDESGASLYGFTVESVALAEAAASMINDALARARAEGRAEGTADGWRAGMVHALSIVEDDNTAFEAARIIRKRIEAKP